MQAASLAVVNYTAVANFQRITALRNLLLPLLAATMLNPPLSIAQPIEDNPLSATALANATYRGLQNDDFAITLTDGEWQGEPYQPGGAVVPQVQLLGNLIARGDVTGDGAEDAVVLVNYAPGGTGQLLHLTLMSVRDGKAQQTAVAFIGDRVKTRDLRIDGDKILLELVQAGPRDASCCPGELATRQWHFADGALTEIDSGVDTGRLSPAALEGQTWQLARWQYSEPVSESAPITLAYEDGKFTGNAGCNNYFAGVVEGDMPGDITVAPTGATRMACPDSATGAAEQRFLSILPAVRQFSWMSGQLILSYGEGTETGTLFFDQR